MSGFFPVQGGGGGGLASPLVSAVLGAPAASISVAGIPTTFQGVSFRNLLVIFGKAMTTNAVSTQQTSIQVNGDSTIGHYGQGTGPGGLSPGFGSAGFQVNLPGTSINQPGGGWFYIFDYADSAQFPSFTGQTVLRTGLAGTAADFQNPNTWNGQVQFVGPITSIAIVPAAGNLQTGTYLEVFGIA